MFILTVFNMQIGLKKFALLPHKTVSQNVAYGLTIQGVKESVAKDKSHRWIDRVGLAGFEERYPAQLSGVCNREWV